MSCGATSATRFVRSGGANRDPTASERDDITVGSLRNSRRSFAAIIDGASDSLFYLIRWFGPRRAPHDAGRPFLESAHGTFGGILDLHVVAASHVPRPV